MCEACGNDAVQEIVVCLPCMEKLILDIATELLVRQEVVKLSDGFFYKETAADLVKTMLEGGINNA